MTATAAPRHTLRARLGIAIGLALLAQAAVVLLGLALTPSSTVPIVVAALGVAAAIAVPLAWRAIRPVEQLVDTADRLAEGVSQATAMRATLEEQVAARTVELSEARDRAEREARLKGVFLAAMSHEIRTPMTSIVGMAELMAETPLDGEQREYCDTIRTSTDALLGVINDILDFSKIEAQGVSLETLDFDLRLVIEDAVELLAVKAATAGLDLAALIEPGFDGRFRGDPSRLRQVIVNLLGNAIKFTARGSVVVRVSTLAGGATDGRVRIEIIDTGVGISPEGLSRLFRPFAQAEDSTARQFGGTGLGLTISKQIVERMGGAIGVESAPGRGSTFWFDLTLPRSTAIDTPPGLTHRIPDALVLEPADQSATALVQVLADLGVRATRVATAGDGLAALHATTAGFAVAFVSIDTIDAAPFVDALEQHWGRPHTPIVALVPANRRRASDLDRVIGSQRLTRPLRRARLVECLETITALRQPAVPLAGHTTPAAAPAPPPRPAVQSAGGAIGAARVLIADDYFANQRLVTRLLEKRGYLVEAVGDGQAAVEATLERHFDLVLMDCNMPILDGYAATARIRSLEQGRRTPILAMTANDSAEDREACRRAGMDDYLMKPIQAAIVLAAVERWSAIGRDQAPVLESTPVLEPAIVPGGTR